MNQPTGFLTNVSVNWKLNLIIGVMIFSLLILFFVGISGMQEIQSSLEVSNNHLLNSNTATNELSESVLIIQSNFEAILGPNLSADDRFFHQGEINIFKEYASNIIRNYATIHLTSNNPELSAVIQENNLLELQEQERAAFVELRRAFDQYTIAENQYQELYSLGLQNEYFAEQVRTRLAQIQQNLSQLVEVNNNFSQAFNEASFTVFQGTVGFMTIVLIFAIFVAWVFVNAIARSIGRRLEYLERSASSIEGHSYDLRTTFKIDGSDEIAMLGNTFDRMFGQLQHSFIELEERVQERTAELAATSKVSERRAQQFEAITLVSSAISSIRSLDELLPRITELISRQFGYYHAGIFLNDENNEFAVLGAANSEGGTRMLDRGHKLRIGEQGIVGYATSTGKARIALDVGEDAAYFDNPDMPETRSEMALPLISSETILGALDVQSIEESAFSDEDINVLSLLADQVSMVIENARLFDQARRSLAESETLYRQFLRQAWSRLPREQNLGGFRYDIHGSTPIEGKESSDPNGFSEEDSKKPIISVPIAIRGETIGTLSVQVPDAKSITEDHMDMVNAVAERVALSAENARLFEETTRRAERERLVSDITVKIRSTNDPEAMIETALNELKSALGATDVDLIPHTLKKTGALPELIESTKQQSEEKSSRKQKKKVE